MWLAPVLSHVANAALRIYYRLHRAGGAVPLTGPVLLVANHPNSLLDPFLVTVAGRRPVRFLAKAPLFSDPLIGWGVRAVGAIPVYRRMDDPAQTGRNEETFRAVHAALLAQEAMARAFEDVRLVDLPERFHLRLRGWNGQVGADRHKARIANQRRDQ